MAFTAEARRERHRLAVQRSRARESPEAREERLRLKRERNQRGRECENPAVKEERLRRERERCRLARASESPLHEVQEPTEAAPAPPPEAVCPCAWVEGEIPRLQPVSAAVKQGCLERLQLALGATGLDEIVCAMCDSWKLATSCRVIKVSDSNRVRQMRQLLSSDGEALPAELVAEYDCSSRCPALAGLLLSERGVHPDGRINVCADCDNSLDKHSYRTPQYCAITRDSAMSGVSVTNTAGWPNRAW
jgi:hypothetical protein